MKTFPIVQECDSLEKLLKQVREVHEFLYDFYRDIPLDYFDARAIPDGWSPKRNLEHIISSNKYFGYWIGAPRFLLSIWGKPKLNQTPVDRLDATNRKGIIDYGVYKPEETPFSQESKDKLLDRLKQSIVFLEETISRRTYEELNTFRAVFGGMNLLTFIYFILKHNIHHSHVVQIRLPK